MGSLLQFRMPDRTDRNRSAPTGIGAGELVIFPGVRIEHRRDETSRRSQEPPREAGFDGLDGGWPHRTG